MPASSQLPRRRKGIRIVVPLALLACAAVALLLTVGPLRPGAGGPLAGIPGIGGAQGFSYSDNLSPDEYDLKDPQLQVEPDHVFELPLDQGVDLGYGMFGPKGTDSLGNPLTDSATGSSAGGASDKAATSPSGGKPTTGSAGTGDQGAKDAPTVAARVFVDGDLTQEFPTIVGQDTNDDGKPVLTVTPDFGSASTDPGLYSVGDDDIFHKGDLSDEDSYGSRWYGFGGYYLVRYVGPDGKPLDKPEVTYFTVQKDVDAEENRMSAPQNVQYAVADNGGLSVSWDGVEGAQGYKVYMMVTDPTKPYSKDAISYGVLAQVDKDTTSINTLDFDPQTKGQLEGGADAEKFDSDAQGSLFFQNNQFRDLVIGDNEDDIFFNRWEEQRGIRGLNVADYAPTKDKVKSVAVTVVALGGGEDQQSPFEFKNINGLLGQIPVETASNVQLVWRQKAPDQDSDPAGYLGSQMISYVSMADGSSKPAARLIDTSKMTSSQRTVTRGEDENDPSTWEQYTYTGLSVPYTVEGTVLKGNIDLDQKNFPGGAADIDRIASEQLQAMAAANPATGLPSSSAASPDIDWNAVQANQKVATTMADVPYPVHGSSDYVKYVASNIMAGNMLIDVTDYATQAGAPDFDDVVEEAVTQNPMTLLYAGRLASNVQDENGRIVVSLYDPEDETNNDEQAMVQKRAQVHDQVKQIVAESVKDGMSDADKVRAINAALCKRLSYDYDHYNIWNEAAKQGITVGGYTGFSAEGLIEDNKVICMGYANIFKACADEAGVTSVVVTGTVPPTPGSENNRHAWNLVNVDGSWKVVDVTWDDPKQDGAVGTDYLLLGMGDDKISGRAYDSTWMLDSKLTSYVDPSLLMAY